MHVESFPVGPLGCNCSIVADLAAKTAIVVDPGGDFDKIRARLEAHGLSVSAIVHTHTHFDHVGATAPLQRLSGAPASIHAGDRFLYDMLPVQASMFGMECPDRAEIDDDLVDGRAIRAGELEMGVLHTPGHTPGSCTFVVASGGQTRVFAGDTLFRGGIGRTDLWGGDSGAIVQSITTKLFTLPEDAVVVTGHGPTTTIGQERRMNPYVGSAARR
jgi:glyoxylase-like metal-dependent hydrolase (beta-lactamase superfamily II)